MSNNETISKICINNLFQQSKYVIPLYQRPFAWGEKEISQLIDDLCSVSTNTYYLGTLVVYKKGDNTYEVIDGQQRLTTLFLLLNCLKQDPPADSLRFECRDKSNTTLKNLARIIDGQTSGLEEGKLEENILQGLKTIQGRLAQEPDKEAFICANLEKVCIVRVEVPPHTDLNQYFEIMNMRGEQLAQHDVLKARLMSMSKLDECMRSRFAKIWDACSNMDGCVVQHFQTSDGKLTESGKKLFGDYRKQGDYPCDEIIDRFLSEANSTDGNGNSVPSKTILELLNGGDSKKDNGNDAQEDDEEEKLHGIIEFPFFLLHVLRVFAGDGAHGNYAYSLDDNKLIETFFNFKSEWSPEEVLRFAKCLLQVRYLFDRFIIKRENDNNSYDDQWCLLVEQDEKHPIAAKDNTLMIEACLRVSYTSPNSMNWLTLLLDFLYKNYESMAEEDLVKKVRGVAEDIAKNAVKKWFAHDDFYEQGQGTPHIVFQYLDYLLWNIDQKQKFKFTFRNSVEHWYPQNPSGFEPWEAKDRFGNLCIMSGSVNSKFSNLPPIGKKEYKELISKGSLKLRKMADTTTNNEDWRESSCKKHEKDMINLLRENLYPNGDNPETLQKYFSEER